MMEDIQGFLADRRKWLRWRGLFDLSRSEFDPCGYAFQWRKALCFYPGYQQNEFLHLTVSKIKGERVSESCFLTNANLLEEQFPERAISLGTCQVDTAWRENTSAICLHCRIRDRSSGVCGSAMNHVSLLVDPLSGLRQIGCEKGRKGGHERWSPDLVNR